MSGRRRTELTEQERSDWAAYVRAVRPLPGRTAPRLPELPSPPAAMEPLVAALAPRTAKPRAAAVAVGGQPGGLDSATWTRFRSGKLGPSRTLDLHGRTAHRAYHAVEAFLHAAYADGVRCVEVITGRGAGEAGGVLRRELPLWLNLPSLRPIVLAATHPHAANPGAVRVLLRRAR